MLKIIFALVVLVFVAIGKNIASVTKEDKMVAVKVIAEYQTASVLAKGTLSPIQEIAFPVAKSGHVATISSTLTTLPQSKTKEISSIAAPIFLLGDIEKNENIAQLSANKRWPVASLTKLMTAVVALEKIPPDTFITISGGASSAEGAAGNFIPGKVFRVEDLIKAMAVVSSNQAAFAIQEFVGKEKFVLLMNAIAEHLGMHDTYFEEATGLSVLNQSTAEDLKILTRYIWKTHNEIFSFSRTPEIKILEKTSGSTIILKNINSFAGRNDFLGGKTGFINESGGNLISIFSRGGRPIITVVLGAHDRFSETNKLMQWFDQTLR